MAEKEKTSEKAEKKAGTAIKYAVLAVVILLVALPCFYGVRSFMTQKIAQSQALVIRNAAQQNRLRAQAALEEAESAAENWASLMRSGNHTYISELQEAAARGSQLLGSKRLYLMDGDGLFYGSDGSVGQMEALESLIGAMTSDTSAIYADGGVLCCVRLKPFTVEGERFSFAIAEFSAQAVFGSALLMDDGWFGCILDGSGTVVAQPEGQDMFDALKNARLEGYLSAAAFRSAVAGQNRLETGCTLSGEKLLLVSEKLENRDFYCLTLCSLETASPTPEGITPVGLILAVLVIAGFGLAAFLLLTLRQQKRRTKAAQEKGQELEQELEEARQTNERQLEQQKQISRDIRTPLNVIVGYTALANRHLQEPETVCRYLEKITESSQQLLERSDEGLEKVRTIEDTPPEEEERPISLVGKRVLLVEDNRLNREIAADILTECGMLVETACNGKEGFQKLSLSQPGYYNVILMDIQMPVMDGCEATKTIRRLRSKMLAEIPIIAMTASVSDEDKKKAFDAGMDGYVEKPMNISKLLWAIQTVLRRSYSTEEISKEQDTPREKRKTKPVKA